MAEEKNYPEHFKKFLEDFKDWEQNGTGAKPFNWEALEKHLQSLGYEVINTRGLPFNGTTYEVRKKLPDVPNGFQICGHYKYVCQIYGRGVTLFVYPPDCKGGKHLNNDEMKLWKHRFDTYDASHPW
jgi:hypothetical protein